MIDHVDMLMLKTLRCKTYTCVEIGLNADGNLYSMDWNSRVVE